MQQGFDELGLPRRRVVGSSPEVACGTARALVAIEARAASNQVALTVIGTARTRFVIPWSDASVAGQRADLAADAATAESESNGGCEAFGRRARARSAPRPHYSVRLP